MNNNSQKYFRSRFTFSKAREALWPIICRYFQRFVGSQETILDLACGYGDFINNIDCAKKYAVDLCPDVAQYLKSDVHFVSTDISQDNWEQNLDCQQFDTIFSSNFLEHLDDSQLAKLMTVITKLLKPGGKIILLQPNYRYMMKEYFDDYTHKKVFTHISLTDFLSAHGFQTTHCEPRFLPASFRKIFLPLFLSRIFLKIYLILPFRVGAQMLLVAKKSS